MLDPAFSALSLPLLEHLPIGVILYRLEDPADDDSLKVLGFSPPAVNMLRADLAKLIGLRIREAFPGVQPDRVATYAELARNGGAKNLGESVYGDSSIAPSVFVVRAAGLGHGCVALFIENLTELKRATGFLDAIIENLPNMLFVKEAKELRFERFNRAGEELLGLERAQLIGKNDYDFFPKEQADFFQERDRATLAGKTVVDIPEEPIQTARGQRWLHTRMVPIADAAGVPQYLLGISEDITERKLADQKLKEAVASLEASNAELDGHGSATLRLLHHFAREARHVDRHQHGLLAPEPREGEKVVDQLPHAARVAAHDAEQPLRLGVELLHVVLLQHLDGIGVESARMIFEQQAREPVDGAQRRAQVV